MNSTPLILAIDTSCDDTAAAVTRGTTILSSVVASQTQLHKQYGGVFPTVAKQAHAENLLPTVQAALKRAQTTWIDIDAIAITQGPGLAPALEVGLRIAKDLAQRHHKPLIAVNHLEGHLLSVLAQPQPRTTKPLPSPVLAFPILGIIVSGRNTLFIKVTALSKYEVLGTTIDDAAGEALDKVGRMLGLGYPAGPVIEEFAKKGDAKKFDFPLPMTTSHDYNLSFSGLKTFARNKVEALSAEKTLSQTTIYDFCASFQFAVCRAITYKLSKLLKNHDFNEIWLGGGVIHNSKFRESVRATVAAHNPAIKVRAPYTKKLCSDNAAMIGVVAFYKWQRGEIVSDTTQIERKPRWPLDDMK